MILSPFSTPLQQKQNACTLLVSYLLLFLQSKHEHLKNFRSDSVLAHFGGSSQDHTHHLGHTAFVNFALSDTKTSAKPAIKRFLEIWNSRGDYSTTKLLVEIARLPGVTRKLTDTLAVLNRTCTFDNCLT